MRIEFPLREIETDFGPLVDPTIVLPVRTLNGYKAFRFILDSGSDLTMVPRPLASELGVDLAGAPELLIAGIEGTGVRASRAHIVVRIGGSEIELPCLYYSDEDAPFVLGRMGLFSRFNVAFDNGRKRIVLESIDP